MNCFKSFKSTICTALCLLGVGTAHAAPVTYSFFTAAGPSVDPAGGPASLFGSGAFVSGTFEYDAAAPITFMSGTSTIYGPQNLPLNNPPFPSSYANLAGSVQGFNFSDSRGSTAVGNDNFALLSPTIPQTTTFVDFLQLNTQSTTPITGFNIGNFSLLNVRMFWIEGQQVPDLVPEFLPNQNLPGVLPAFHGRLALDFVTIGDPTAQVSRAFFDGLTVTPIPEPETYAMLLAGLGLLGWHARRRKLKEAALA